MFEEFKETLRRVLLEKYSIGFIDGYETGKADGYTEGYTDGTKAGGFTDGYRAGKTDGYREGHEGGIKAGGFVDGYETGYEVGYKEGSEDERKGIRRLSPSNVRYMRGTYKSVEQRRNRSKPHMGGTLRKGGRCDGWEERCNV